MPQGEKFLHGNQSHAQVKIGKKSKLFGKKGNEPEKNVDLALQEAKKGKSGWKYSVKNEITYKPLSAQKPANKHVTKNLSGLGNPPITNDNVTEAVVTPKPAPKLDYSKLVQKERKGKAAARGFQQAPQDFPGLPPSTTQPQPAPGPTIIMGIQPFPAKGTGTSPPPVPATQAGPSFAAPPRSTPAAPREIGGFTKGSAYTAPTPLHAPIADPRSSRPASPSSVAAVIDDALEEYDPFEPFDFNAVYHVEEYKLKKEYRLTHQLQVLYQAIDDYRVNGLPYGKKCPPTLREYFPGAP